MRLERSPDVVHDVVDGRAVLVDADGREMITLNPTGTLVWQELDGERDVAQIAHAVHARVTGATLEEVETAVLAFAEELRDEGLAVEA